MEEILQDECSGVILSPLLGNRNDLPEPRTIRRVGGVGSDASAYDFDGCIRFAEVLGSIAVARKGQCSA